MLAETVARLDFLEATTRPVIVCGKSQEDLVTSEVGDRKPLLVLEPEAKNTAPAIAAACLALTADGENPMIAVLAADHVIADPVAFSKATNKAAQLADQGFLVTYGVVPQRPATGYGYIKQGDALEDGCLVEQFAEKPDSETALTYVQEGYLWNSGMFVFRAQHFLEELRAHRPDIAESTKTAVSINDGQVSIDPSMWANVPAESIDYAVMEQTSHAAVVSLDAGWNDLGSWRTLLDIGKRDPDGNVAHGEHILYDTTSTFVRATKPVVTIGVRDLIIVETEDAILVSHKDRTQDVKSAIVDLPDDLR